MLCKLPTSVVVVCVHGEREPKVLSTEDMLCARNFAIMCNGYYFMFVTYFNYI